MCMLTYFPPGVQPDVDALMNGATFNEDGHGFAIVAGDRLIIRHGMTARRVIDKFAKLRHRYPDGPAMFHSRYGTGGTVGRFNCHPFYIGGDRKTVLAHNGVLPAMVQPGKKDRRCDTRLMCEDLLSGEDLGDQRYLDSLAEWITKYNKLVILSVNPDYGYSGYIVNESSGIWEDDGIWYSNDDYLPLDTKYPAYVPSKSATGTARWNYELAHNYADPDVCAMCETRGAIDLDRAICTACNTCQDCLEAWDDCECYLPASKRRVRPMALEDSDPIDEEIGGWANVLG